MIASREDLSNLLKRNEKRDVETKVVDKLDPQVELAALITKVAELQALFREAQLIENFPVESSRLTSLYLHVAFRVRRIIFHAQGYLYQELRRVDRNVAWIHEKLRTSFPGCEFPLLTVQDDAFEELERATSRLAIQENRRDDSAGRDVPRQEEGSRRRSTGDSESTRRSPPKSRDAEKPQGEVIDESSSHTGSSSSSDHRSSRTAQKRTSKSGKKSKRSRKSRHRRKKRRSHRRSSSSSSGSTESSPSSGSSTDSEEKPKSSRRKSNPVASWKIRRYTGLEDLMAFLDEVDELRETHSVSERDLLQGIGSLLGGNAKSWYRSARERIYTWPAFVKSIRSAFLPSDCDDEILDRVRKMRQREDETYVVYAARMEDQFRRLEDKLDNKKKLKLLMGGLHLYYKNKVCEQDIHSEAALRMACGKWEGAKPAIMKREKEKDRNERGDRDRGKGRRDEDKQPYNRDFHRRSVNTFAVEEGKEDTGGEPEDRVQVDAAVPTGARPATSCWRCGGFGHLSIRCQEKIFCISCGLQDTLAERCQNCAGAAARGLWRQQAAFPTGAWAWGNQAPTQPPPLMQFTPMNVPPPSFPPPCNLLNETAPDPTRTLTPRILTPTNPGNNQPRTPLAARGSAPNPRNPTGRP